jgi:hypothetical protein
MRNALIVAVALTIASGLCLAQSERGSITGVVSDSSGARIPGVSIEQPAPDAVCVEDLLVGADLKFLQSPGGFPNAG